MFDTIFHKQAHEDTAILAQHVTNDAEKRLHDYKAQAIAMAKDNAKGEGRAPTMSDYYLASEHLGETHKQQMADQGISWSPQVYADVRGQSFDGFLIRKQEIEPTPDIQRYALAQAYKNANGEQPTTEQMIEAMRQTNDQLEAHGTLSKDQQEDLENLQDLYDLDGDDTINPFYTAVANQTNFEGTEFSNVTFHPAGTLTQFHSEGASFDNVTFDGMTDRPDARGETDQVRLSSGTYKNIQFTNITGGSIEVDDHARVDGMDISGQTAKLVIGAHALVNNLNATGTNIVTLTAEPGSQISNARFDNSTIGMDSTLNGCRMNKVSFENTNLAHVDMQGASLSNITINGSVTGMDLSGANLQNVKINGHVIDGISGRKQLAEMGVKTDNRMSISASDDFIKQAKLDAAMSQALGIGNAMKAILNNGLGISAAEPQANPSVVAAPQNQQPPAKTVLVDAPVEMADALDTVPTKFEKVQIQGGTTVNFNDIQNVATAVTPPVTQEAQQKPEQATPNMDYYRQMSATNGRANG